MNDNCFVFLCDSRYSGIMKKLKYQMTRYHHKALYTFLEMKGWANWYEPVIKYPTQNWEPKKHTLSLKSKKIKNLRVIMFVILLKKIAIHVRKERKDKNKN